MMKTQHQQLFVHLLEIPTEGRDFCFQNNLDEGLTAILSDLIGTNEFMVQLHIRPIGNAFAMTGQVRSAMNLQCSLCTLDFQLPVEELINEVIVIQPEPEKSDKDSRVNHVAELSTDGPSAIVIPTPILDLGEYLHELIALAEPMRPLGRKDCETTCPNRPQNIEREWLSWGREDSKALPAHPFDILKNYKLNR